MEQLVNFIIRPPRAEYDPDNDLLEDEFTLKGKWYERKDLEVTNSRGDVLQCSHYMPIIRTEGKALPCVIYCHGNSGCRADASEAAIILLRSNITVFALDFSGSGLSGGEHVTLGWNEKDDLRAVVDYLRKDGNVSLIGLWGRSMGAVTSLMYGAEDPSIAGMVLDSPFSDLVDLMMELVDTYKVRLPKFTVKFAIQYMRRAILKKAKFDITDLNAIKVAKTCFVPVLFGHATDDDFIHPHHSDRIFEAYVGDKNIIKFDGDHNSPRPQFYFDSINIFFHNVLQPPEDEVGETFYDTRDDYFRRDHWNSVHEVGYADPCISAGSTDPAVVSNPEEAIKKLRSRRPMSRMEVPSDMSPKDKQSGTEEEESSTEPTSSSSEMISFELSNSHPYGPHNPTSIDDDDDDDEYVEYPLDNVGDFPSNHAEEERMFMEAIMKSLKDLDTSQSNHANISSPAEEVVGVPKKAEILTTTTLVNNSGCSGAQDKSGSSEGPATGPSPSCVESSSKSSSSVDTRVKSVVVANAEEEEDCTKATVTVVKNPSNNIMETMRRWDFNFFRNGR